MSEASCVQLIKEKQSLEEKNKIFWFSTVGFGLAFKIH